MQMPLLRKSEGSQWSHKLRLRSVIHDSPQLMREQTTTVLMDRERQLYNLPGRRGGEPDRILGTYRAYLAALESSLDFRIPRFRLSCGRWVRRALFVPIPLSDDTSDHLLTCLVRVAGDRDLGRW